MDSSTSPTTGTVMVPAEAWEAVVAEIGRLRTVVEGNQKLTRRSPSTAKINAALAKAQGKIEAPRKSKVAKVRSDKGNYEFSYADLADIIDAVRGPLAEAGISRTQDVVIDPKTGQAYLQTRLDFEDEWIVGMLPMPDVTRLNPQQIGSTLTYLRRYGLSTLLGLAGEEDDDANAAVGNYREIEDRRGPATKQPPAPPPRGRGRSAEGPPPGQPGDPGPDEETPRPNGGEAAPPAEAQKALTALSKSFAGFLDDQTGEIDLKGAERAWKEAEPHFRRVGQHTIDAMVDRYRKVLRRDPPPIDGLTYPERHGGNA